MTCTYATAAKNGILFERVAAEAKVKATAEAKVAKVAEEAVQAVKAAAAAVKAAEVEAAAAKAAAKWRASLKGQWLMMDYNYVKFMSR